MKDYSPKKLLKLGMNYAQSPLDKRRIAIFNYLILFALIVAVSLGLVTYAFGFVYQPFICVSASLLFVLAFYLNGRGAIELSKMFFVIASVGLISLAKYLNIQDGLSVGVENMLFAGMAISMFLIDGLKKHLIYWLIFTTFISLKVLEFDSAGLLFGTTYMMTIINNFVVAGILYLFLYVFRSVLVKAFTRSDQHEQTLRSLLDNVPVFMAMMDLEERYILVNQNYADRFKMDTEDIVGKKRSEVLPSHIYNKQKPMFKKALKGKPITFLEESELPDGSTISANGKYEPIKDADGKTIAVTVCVDDVTELVKTQEALKTASETKDKLFSIIAHDIKSPLNLFQSILNLKNDDVITNDQFMEYQESIKDRLSKLSGTVDELLSWSRMQLGGINAYPAKVNVNSVVQENAELFDSLIKRKNIDFKIDASPEIEAWIDENHFKVALRNLIHNAIKYTSGGGFVQVIGDQTEKETIVSVVDSGIGMSSQRIESIIKKEIQNSKVGTDKEMGAGLGLSLSFGLLEKNNCDVSVMSEPDKGTKIEIKIPNEY